MKHPFGLPISSKYIRNNACWSLFLLLCFCFGLSVSPGVASAMNPKSYCSGVYQCLSEKPESCDDALCEKNPHIEYSPEFCEVFRMLRKRGLGPESRWGRRIYSYLSMPYRVTYTVEGSLPILAGVMRYLISHISFSAHLVNAYQGTGYSVEYIPPNKKQFRADNGKNVSGVFNTVLQDTDRIRNVYFGYGTTKILFWELGGSALVLFDCDPRDRNSVTYRISCLVFPSSGLIKSILNFYLFKKTVLGILKETVENVQVSAMQFHKGDLKPINKYPLFNTPEGRREIEAFQRTIRDCNAEAP